MKHFALKSAWIGFAGLVALSACSTASSPSFTLEPFVSGLSQPVYLTHAGGSDLYAVEQNGTVKVISNGQVRSAPFLNMGSQVSKGGEQGLLSIAFHPNYAQNSFVFAYYTDSGGNLQISRFTANQAAKTVDVSTEKKVLNIPHPGQDNHNGGQLQFGPDGFLYAATGDGGGSGDPDGNGQNTQSLLGKMLRLDINVPDSSTPAYAIPNGNPFKNGGGRGEIWAFGLRNPWRFSFDRQTGDVWVADVGQGAIEEVNFEPKNTPGRNYGWDTLEGSRCFEATTCDKTGKTLPVFEYTRSDGNSVTGGYVYRGASSQNTGKYVVGDFGSGKLWTVFKNGSGQFISRAEATKAGNISSFGEDKDGELYLVDYGGKVQKIVWR